ncbi:MAG TPA: AtpZ/AtpI family protein [Anaerovoracaceae bacterium]|nr:AtpZ/AtpI family protein [Anaerovoracaceae bacterium]
MGSGKKEEPPGSDRGDKKKSSPGSGLEAFALISQLGLTMALPIVLGAAAGHWIDVKLGTGMVFFLVLLCFGLAGGFIGAYHLIVVIGKRKK